MASRTPGAGATGILQTTAVSVQFTENITNAGSGTIKLKQGAAIISANIDYNSTTFTATITPFEQLAQSTEYTVEILGGPTGIQDASGNRMTATASWTFTTAADTIPPAIVSRYPVASATGCQLKPAITVTFSEPVTGVNGSSFYLTGTSIRYVMLSTMSKPEQPS
jgi:hypothetical protein